MIAVNPAQDVPGTPGAHHRASEKPLATILANRRWTVSTAPFPHAVADGVFTPAFLSRLAGAVRETVASQQGMVDASEHDIMVRTLNASDPWPVSLFYSPEWQEMLGGLFGIPVTGEVTGAIHHHRVESANGYVHNDLRRDWLAGTNKSQTLDVAERPRSLRGVAVLIYLANEPWSPGDGGETALYRSATDPADAPMRVVPPVNNRLLAFPCSPLSFHAFRSNTRNPRNSIVMWTHQPTDQLIARWKDLLGIVVR